MRSVVLISVLVSVVQFVQADWNYSQSAFLPTSGTLNPNASADVSTEVYNQLKTARGYTDRLNTLLAQNNTDLFKFNFNPKVAGVTASRGAGGLAVLADSTTAPVLVNTGVAMALGFLEPCGESPRLYPSHRGTDSIPFRRKYSPLSSLCHP